MPIASNDGVRGVGASLGGLPPWCLQRLRLPEGAVGVPGHAERVGPLMTRNDRLHHRLPRRRRTPGVVRSHLPAQLVDLLTCNSIPLRIEQLNDCVAQTSN